MHGSSLYFECAEVRSSIYIFARWRASEWLLPRVLQKFYLYTCTHSGQSQIGDMPKQRKSKSQLEKKSHDSRQRIEKFLIEKDKTRDAEGSMARQAALEKLGLQQEFGFKDHDGIYSYADYSAPIKTIDASVAPPVVTEYPEFPRSEFSTPPAFNVDVDRNKKSTQDTVLPATASRDFSRLRRAQRIMAKNIIAVSVPLHLN